VYAVSDQTNVIFHWDGVRWVDTPLLEAPAFQSIWGSGPGNVVALATDSSVWTWDGMRWSTMGRAPFGNRFARARVWGSAGELVVVDGGARALRWDGTTWSATEKAVPGQRVYAVWRQGKDDLFGLMTDEEYGAGSIARWNGAGWTTLVSVLGLRFASIWAGKGDDVFAVGRASPLDAAVIVHGVGAATWSVKLPGIEESLNSVWGSGGDDVFTVGTGGAIAHWDGSDWTSMDAGTGAWLTSVWGSGPEDVFVVGEAGTILHWDGKAWTPMESGTTEWLFCVWGTGRNNAFAVGRSGTILRWDGTGWNRMRSGTTADLGLIRGGGAGDIFAAGGDVLLYLRAGAWEPIAHPADNPIQEVSVDGGRVLLFGAGMTRLDRASVTCLAPEQDCLDGWDNDCDGAADGADRDCAGKVAEQCANAVDDDGDGKVDCGDPDCANFPSCKKR
jgi:hypothetical protein